MQFWRPGDPNRPRPPPASPTEKQTASTANLAEKRFQLLYALETHQTVLFLSGSESGRTAEVPRQLARAGWSAPGKCIAVALPNQASALSAALRFANDENLDESHLGGECVGYAVSRGTRRSAETKVVYFTNDALISAIFTDPLLASVSVVVVDDVQERRVSTDLLLALLKRIQQVRCDLRLLVAGDDFNTDEAFDFFGRSSCALVEIPSHRHRVRVMFSKEPVENFLHAAFDAVTDAFEQWNRAGRPCGGNVLVFVTGADEAEQLCERINNWFAADVLPSMHVQKRTSSSRASRDLVNLLRAVPLYSSLDKAGQLEAMRNGAPEPQQRIVVATNVAEAKLPVEGISTVIDCGFEKVDFYDCRSGTTSPAVVPVSRALARQRATRAGREAVGTCIRLYTRSFMNSQMTDHKPPELLRCDLTATVVTMKALGIDSIYDFEFMTPPRTKSLADALERLHVLGGITADSGLTAFGARLSHSTLSPRMMKSINIAERYGVGEAVAAIAAMLEVKHQVFNTQRRWDKSRSRFAVAEGDLLTLLNVWRRFGASGQSDAWCREQGVNVEAMRKARRAFSHISKSALLAESKPARMAAAKRAIGRTLADCVRRSITSGFFEHAAMVQPDGSYLMILSGRRVHIHSSSVLRDRMPRWVVFTDLVNSGGVCHIRDVTVVEPEWLVEFAPDVFELLVSGKTE